MSLLGLQLPSISDIVNGFINAVANAVNTVIKWLADSVGWLWSQIYNYIVKPIGDFINWLFETAKNMFLSPILGFLGNALNVIQKKAFGTLYIAITYKLMYKEMIKLVEVKNLREGLKEAFWLVLKPMIIYLALSMFWKMIIISSPASAFGVPPPLTGQFTPVPPPSVAQPPIPSAPVPWQITLYDKLDTTLYAGYIQGLEMNIGETFDTTLNAGVVLPNTLQILDRFDTTGYYGVILPGVLTIAETFDATQYADIILPKNISISDAFDATQYAGVNLQLVNTISDTFDTTQYAGVGAIYEVTVDESEPTLVLSGGVT